VFLIYLIKKMKQGEELAQASVREGRDIQPAI
jgi:hypothetical protein